MRPPLLIAVAVLLALGAASCAKAQARTEPAMPLLAPPPPPPRTVETYLDEPMPTTDPGPVDNALTAPSPRTAPRPPARTDAPAKPEPARTEPDRPGTPSPPSLTLKPAPGSESTVASIRNLLNRASRDLSRTDYKLLNTDGRAQYDTAKRFMQQAEEALKGGNLVFAGKLADKAATMASVLVR